MIKNMITYDWQTTRKKGIEIIDTFGEYGSYYVYSDNAEAEKEHYSGGSIFNEKIESVLDAEVEYDTGKIAHNKSMRAVFNDMDHSAFGEIKNESIESESIKLTGYWEKHTLLVSSDTEEDNGNTDKGYRTINPIGTQMVEFLNFDIDSYVNGSWSISYKVEDGERIAINGWKYKEPHNLDNMYQRPAIALEMQIGMDTNIKEFQQEYVPFFIRCFYGLMIDFGEWKYNTAGIEGIKKLQKKYRELCDRVFISDAEGDSLWERYCMVHEISDESDDVIKCIRKNCKKNAETGAKWLKELDVDTSPHTIEMLDGLLGAEFDAMLYKNVNLKKCANCGEYFIANKSDAQFCKKKYTLESYYLRKEDMDKEKEADRRYKLGIEDDTLKDRIVMPTVSFCDDSVHMIKQFNKKWGEHPILYASLREKNRLRHFIEANLSDLHEVKLVYKLGDSDSGPLVKAIQANQESYATKYDEALKESKEKAEIVLQEYVSLLIETVNKYIKANAPKSKLDFQRKKAYKE